MSATLAFDLLFACKATNYLSLPLAVGSAAATCLHEVAPKDRMAANCKAIFNAPHHLLQPFLGRTRTSSNSNVPGPVSAGLPVAKPVSLLWALTS